jgi:hypothetical protein
MTEVVVVACAVALVIPSLVIFLVLETTTPSPVYWDAGSCRFRKKAELPDVGAKSWARTVATERNGGVEDAVMSEDDAALALAVQLSVDELETSQATSLKTE